jgi:low affinity Fe/Cu permease
MKPIALFRKFAQQASLAMGTAYAFSAAVLLLVIWAALGPFVGFSDSWQLVVNTSTTVVTFLMVFLIQSTQNRESVSMQLKLDELLRTAKAARSSLVDLEDLSDEEIERLRNEFKRLARKPKLG